MENTAVLNVRISKQLKQQLEELAKEQNQSVSDYVRELLTKHVLQDCDSVSGISPELMEKIKAEAQRRRQPESHIIQAALRFAFDNLFVHPGRLGMWVRW